MSATTQFQTWLVKAHEKAKLTYAQLAEKAGVSTATLHSIEHGEGSPSLDTAEKIAKAFGVSMEAVFRVRTVKPKPIPVELIFPSASYTPDEDT